MKSDKTVVRTSKESNFVVLSRFPLEDERLTWEARGLYAFLLAKPDNWQISLRHLSKSSPSGYDKAKRILKELIDLKYIHKKEYRNQSGRFSSPIYTRHELPYDGYFTQGENPLKVKPVREKPSSSDPDLINIYSNKETKIITTTTTLPSLEWPEGLSLQEQTSIQQFVGGITEEDAQLLVDELGGQLRNISNPVGYFHSLLKKYRDGLFVPAAGTKHKAHREKLAANTEAVRLANEYSEKQCLERLKKIKLE